MQPRSQGFSLEGGWGGKALGTRLPMNGQLASVEIGMQTLSDYRKHFAFTFLSLKGLFKKFQK